MAMSSSSNGRAVGLGVVAESMTIVVRFNASQSYLLDVTVQDSIKDVKEKLALKADTATNNINLVLAGQLLENHRLIKECGLGAHTTVHAFCWSDDGLAADSQPISPSGSHLETEIEGSPQTNRLSLPPPPRENRYFSSLGSRIQGQNRFFIFCKLCDCVRPGKLRVECKQCHSGAFLVERGPSDWDDISPDTRIRGECKSCPHDVPIFLMRCCESHSEELAGTAVVLKHVQANRRRIECIICGDVMSLVLIFPCSPGHVMCLDCFRQYGSSCLSERRFVEHPVHGYTLPCPAGCPEAYIEETHHFLLMGKDKYERYKNFGAEEFVLQNGGILCPAPGCGMGLFPEDSERGVLCRECQFLSCRECLREYHPGDCEEHLQSQTFHGNDLTVDEERAERACWEQESLSLIEETTKACPGCKTKTEKSGGCMHMVCSRCSKEWCWLCVKPWTRDCQADHWFG
ncbi:E3 ubiquitin-protein ligase parkin [Aplysia californica]|uniref:E3 ubiquitin-protein ligase parkin n=1 Tax=Aplysia californica TaxID=6500 RepID=A0ABM0JLC8_APLCA|nr:E3 ubiquitin-protein ligase parkin [Aplysia californica]